MQIVAHANGVMLDATSLSHDGQTFDGPVFDVPPEVGSVLLSRPTAFRVATVEEVAQPKKPKAAKTK